MSNQSPASNALTLSIDHSIFYSTAVPIPAFEVAEALLALDRIVGRIPGVMRAMVPGFTVERASLFVEKIETGSLKEHVVVRLFFGSQKKMDKSLDSWRKKMGTDLSRGGIPKVILFTLIAAGVSWAIHWGTSSDPAPSIDMSHMTIVNIGAKEAQIDGDQISRIVTTVVASKSRLASDVVDFAKPAKRDAKASISIDGTSGFTLPASTIAQLPNSIDPIRDEESVIREHTVLSLRALDLDNLDKGWAAVAVPFSPERLRLELAEGVNPMALFGKTEITGTVELIKRRGPKGLMEPKTLRLLSIDPAP